MPIELQRQGHGGNAGENGDGAQERTADAVGDGYADNPDRQQGNPQQGRLADKNALMLFAQDHPGQRLHRQRQQRGTQESHAPGKEFGEHATD